MMITANEAKARVRKYNEEQFEMLKKEADKLADLASAKVVEAANKGEENTIFEVRDNKVKGLFIRKFREAGFVAEIYNDSETKVIIKW